MPIAPSELIITPRGSIYHLNLRPDELADTIITVGDPGRVAVFEPQFDEIECRQAHREFVSFTGRIGSKRLTVLSTGIGPDNIDITFTELDALANIDFATREPKAEKKSLQIIRLGTCGGLQADLPVDTCVASAYAIGLDNLLHFYQRNENANEAFMLNELEAAMNLHQTPLRPYVAEGSIRLLHAFAGRMPAGITVTCPGFYAPQGRKLRAAPAFPNLIDALRSFSSCGHRVTNFEMETAAMYGMSRLLGHASLSISVIVANRAAGTFSEDGTQAIARMITQSLPVILNLT
ncbi:MAG: nucleoside phosphorylase [Bacteroidetes bacterium]|nr:nucleoside phosphorylase [Bacteroidota bacterium]MBS1630334.1 nucleoside phosphorylase [Bacteroidota bacterium]